MNSKKARLIKRHKKIRSKLSGSAKIPRLSVFKSNKHLYGQLIDDLNRRTIIAYSDKQVNKKGSKVEIAFSAGEMLALAAKKKKIEKVVFDRGGFIYHGRVKSFAQGARKGGLLF